MFGRAAPLLALREGLLAEQFRWAISNDILLEYEEVALREMGSRGVERMLRFTALIEQTRRVVLRASPTFRFHVIAADPDDDKFADCAIVTEADFILTEDRHFEALRGSGYRPQPMAPREFIRQHLAGG
jgi:predicted nucleic acid-binding protein